MIHNHEVPSSILGLATTREKTKVFSLFFVERLTSNVERLTSIVAGLPGKPENFYSCQHSAFSGQLFLRYIGPLGTLGPLGKISHNSHNSYNSYNSYNSLMSLMSLMSLTALNTAPPQTKKQPRRFLRGCFLCLLFLLCSELVEAVSADGFVGVLLAEHHKFVILG